MMIREERHPFKGSDVTGDEAWTFMSSKQEEKEVVLVVESLKAKQFKHFFFKRLPEFIPESSDTKLTKTILISSVSAVVLLKIVLHRPHFSCKQPVNSIQKTSLGGCRLTTLQPFPFPKFAELPFSQPISGEPVQSDSPKNDFKK